MAMMQGMMGMANPAMHMAMMQQMGMVPPHYMHPMHGGMPPPPPPGMPPFGPCMGGVTSKKRRGKDGASGSKHGADGSGVPPTGADASSSSSSDSSSEDSSAEDDAVGAHPAAAMAPMGMWPGAPAAGSGLDGAGGVEAFLAQCPVDPEAADRLRALPPHLQQAVMRRGPVSDTRNPSAVLIARVRDAEIGRGGPLGPGGGGCSPPPGDFGDRGGLMDFADDKGPKPARRSAKATIEAMIQDYRLSPGCAWMLRALPPDKQKMASRIDPSGQADPSGFVAEQLKKIV